MIGAGILYFALVFALGFVLGTLRVLWLEPAVGDLAAVLIELPVMLGAAWWICRALVNRFQVPPDGRHRLGMGALALGLLLSAEWLLSLAVFDRAPGEIIAQYGTAHGAAGLAGQLVFGFMPLLLARDRHPAAGLQ